MSSKIVELNDRHGWRNRIGMILLNKFGEIIYGCSRCDAEFRSAQNYEIHIRSGHRMGAPGKIVNFTHPSNIAKEGYENKTAPSAPIPPAPVLPAPVLPAPASDQTIERTTLTTELIQVIEKLVKSPPPPPVSTEAMKKSIQPFAKLEVKKSEGTMKPARRSSIAHSCEPCKKVFANAIILNRHNERCPSKKVKCNYCVKTFQTVKGLYQHERNHHGDKLPYPCMACPRAFKNGDQLRTHRHDQHFRKSIRCEFCSVKLATLYEKTNHDKEHHSDRRYYCMRCTDFRTQSAVSLRRHERIEHGMHKLRK